MLTFKNRSYPTLVILSLFILGHKQGILLEDSGYALKSYSLTPYLNPIEPHIQRFNTAHCRTRVLIKRTFGILKRKFSSLHTEVRLSPQRACTVVVACCVLHNIEIFRGDILSNVDIQDDGEEVIGDLRVDGKAVRDHIALNYF